MSKELREEFNRVKAEALEIVNKAKAENRDLSAEEKEANDKRFSRLDQIKRQLDEEARFAALKVAELPQEVIDAARGNPAEPKAKQEFEQGHGRVTGDVHRNKVNNYIRTGQVPHELFTITAGAGGVTLPAGPPVVIKRNPNPFKAALQAFGLEVLTVPGVVNIPIFDDSANIADVIPQNSTSENVKEAALTNLVPGDVLYDSGTQWHAITLLNSTDYDLLAYFRPMMDARIEERQVADWTATITTGAGAAATGVTTASTTGVTFGELVALKYSIPANRQNDGFFIVSRGLMQAVESMVDANGRPLYRESLSADAPDRLLGWPVFVSDALAAPGAGAVSAIAASARSLVLREVGPRRMVTYRDYPLRPDQIGLRAFANGGAGFVASGVRLLRHAAA